MYPLVMVCIHIASPNKIKLGGPSKGELAAKEDSILNTSTTY